MALAVHGTPALSAPTVVLTERTGMRRSLSVGVFVTGLVGGFFPAASAQELEGASVAQAGSAEPSGPVAPPPQDGGGFFKRFINAYIDEFKPQPPSTEPEPARRALPPAF